MTARELYQAGRLEEAVQALSGELRDNPGDAKRRTFLFELLCFAGKYDRAEKQLDVLAQEGPDAMTGALLYRAALSAERTRQEMFEKNNYPHAPVEGPEPKGNWNGKAFEAIEDADPRIGPRLEVFAAGQYIWMPFSQISSVEMEAPKRLRDLLWVPALIHAGPAFQGREMGEVLLPALTPLSFLHPDEEVRLGRVTEWQEVDGQTRPCGLKMFLIDDEEVPILDIRRLEIHAS